MKIVAVWGSLRSESCWVLPRRTLLDTRQCHFQLLLGFQSHTPMADPAQAESGPVLDNTFITGTGIEYVAASEGQLLRCGSPCASVLSPLAPAQCCCCPPQRGAHQRKCISGYTGWH